MLFVQDEDFYMDRQEVFGPDLCARFRPLSSCWLESFTDAARRVAKRKDLPPRRDRAFLLFIKTPLAAARARSGGRRR
jgi:hypothetical protein